MLFFYNDIVIVRVSSIMIVEECTVLNCDHKDHERCSMEEQHNSRRDDCDDKDHEDVAW